MSELGIKLFSDILKGVGRNPQGDGKKKGGLKVHMLIDAVQSVGRFVKITEARSHDKNFLKSLELISYSILVFDKAYNYCHQFALWTQKQVYFVTRLRKNAVYRVVETKRTHYRKKGQTKALKDEIVEIGYHPEDENGKRNLKETRTIRLRKVCYQDEQNRYYEFLTNNFEITAEEVAFLYKKRWGIELLFYGKYIIMQSRSKSNTVNQSVISQLYTTTLHNNITVEDFSASQAGSDSSPIHIDWPFRGQGSYMLFLALRASA